MMECGEMMRGGWELTLSTANATRQTSSKHGLPSLLWQSCRYLYWPRKRTREIDSLITTDNSIKLIIR